MTTKVILVTEAVITATLKVISVTTKVIFATEEVITTTLKVTSTTTKIILPTEGETFIPYKVNKSEKACWYSLRKRWKLFKWRDKIQS